MSKENILVVDDDKEIRKLIKDFLQKEGYSVETAGNGRTAISMLSENLNKYSLVVLDLMLPDISGIDVCKKIRELFTLPVIMLTAKSEDIDKITGFEAGADDYITKPFNPGELVARIKAITRRTYIQEPYKKKQPYGIKQDSSMITVSFKQAVSLKNVVVGKLKKHREKNDAKIILLEINPEARKVYVNGSEVRLTNKEFNMLLYFVENKNIVISRETLLENIWGYDFVGQSRTIDVHVKELRKKILDVNGSLIETIWAVGYRLNA
ncbi:MAG: response regulator transcription factor [Actinobacteria bacterium]|nr:response regulator transcription factor [Actinomycetota bacterium]